MKKINYIILLFSLLLFCNCETDSYELGDLINPSNLSVIADIQGQDNDNPFGDGSGNVVLTATAENAITYKFTFNGVDYMEPSGIFSTRFTNTGTNMYDIQVTALGTGGLTQVLDLSIEVLYTFEPPADLVQALLTGSWRVMAESPGHLGVHDLNSFHDGENSLPEWYSAAPYDKADTAMYDDRLVFSSDGTMEYQTQGSILGKSVPLENEFYGDQGLTPVNDEYPFYPVDNFTSTWSISESDEGNLILSFSGNGFAGFYVGGDHTYIITNRNSSELYLRTVGFDNLAWYTKLTNAE